MTPPNQAIVGRIELVPELAAQSLLLSDDEMEDLLLEFRRSRTNPAGSAFSELDISNLTGAEVRNHLLTFDIALDTLVGCLWIDDRTALALPYSYFVEYYDDFWYPSRDNVWVSDSKSWWLLFDHEEILVFQRFTA